MTEKAIFKMTNKPRRQKMFKVSASYRFDGDWSDQMVERARFLHPGDAYGFAKKLHDADAPNQLIEVQVEC